jgi:predicted NUDIX family NTP pyrophosphohydrolase
MPKLSAGILFYRLEDATPKVLLVHPGGPFWAKKDLGAWSIPKGEYEPGDDPLEVAMREVEEEIGIKLTPSDRDSLIELGSVRHKSGKLVCAWAAEGDVDVSRIRSNTFELEWPPRSGRTQTFPEVDRAEWFDAATALAKINSAQVDFIERLVRDVLHFDGEALLSPEAAQVPPQTQESLF